MPPKPWLYQQRLESLLQHRSVQAWLGRTPKKVDFYIFQDYLKWRKEKGFGMDPDRWIPISIQSPLIVGDNFAVDASLAGCLHDKPAALLLTPIPRG